MFTNGIQLFVISSARIGLKESDEKLTVYGKVS